MPGGGCEEGSLGHEAVDMNFFAEIGCDHVMVDSPAFRSVPQFKESFAAFGAAIANSTNPNMVYGAWGAGQGKTWKWAGSEEVGATYWRMADDSYDNWLSLMRQWDTTYSIPGVESFTSPGKYAFLDQLIVGDVPGRKGSAYGTVSKRVQQTDRRHRWNQQNAIRCTPQDICATFQCENVYASGCVCIYMRRFEWL
jgi:hypothetical protein